MQMNKKKIVIFTVAAGGGHTAATQALTEYLGSAYEIVSMDFITDVLPLYIGSKQYSFNQAYNFLLRKNCISFLNFGETLVWTFFKMIKPLSAFLIQKAIAPYKPDCIISVEPLGNNATLLAARKLNIPFFIIPVDFDPRTFLYDIKKVTYGKFFVAQVMNNPKIHQCILNTGVKEDRIIHTGFIIRPEFLEPKDPQAIKKALNIPENIPIVMIMLGSTGSDKAYKIAEQLHKIRARCHIIFCLGRSSDMAEEIKALRYPSNLSIQTFGFTKEISNLLAVADIYVTKPGSNSVAEALRMNVPMIIARFGKNLKWEQFNTYYLPLSDLGMIAEGADGIQRAISDLLNNSERLKRMKANLKAREQANIKQNLLDALARILG